MNRQRDSRRLRRLAIVSVAVIAWTSLSLAAEVTVKDRTGAQIVLPHATRPSLVLFLRMGQDQSLEAITNARTLLTDMPDTQVVVVLSGKLAAGEVTEFAAGIDWPIVIDRDYALVGTFTTRAWPMTVILPPGGDELARLSGMPQSYSDHVRAYLAFAAGKIDQQTLNRRLASAAAVADNPYQMAVRHLRVAQRLMDKGLVKAAGVELDKGLQLQPDEPRLQLARARMLLLLNQPRQAIALLAQLDASTALSSKIGVRKGAALVMLGQWDEAIVVLKQAAKLNPYPSESLYLLGVSYQHKNQWPKAAKAFRGAFEATASGRNIAVMTQPTSEPAPATQPATGTPGSQPMTGPPAGP